MKIRRSASFSKDYKNLPVQIQTRADKQLLRLVENPKHPSLRIKKLRGTEIFEIRVTRGYRLTFKIEKEFLILRRIGTHDLLKQEGRR
ncbi:MAG: DNA helicase [Deltaproteobacteria bacterium]|nr:DNA helicase [Deltaproteobacteria bacterium]MBW1964937.1 DNA helicase [Deltaproteobacteria bacterium]MBW2351329.1 DNA helicase [Deltaproteobacteria bacterium]